MVVTVEVIDAVQRTLEQDGLLQSLKAQLRSSVLRIVKQSGERITASNPNLNFVRSFEGAPIIQLVRDILVHLNLRETVLVFDAETGYEEIEGREFETFLQKLGITKSNKNGSYLEQLVQNTLQGPKPSIPHAASREEQVNSKGPSPTIHQSRSMSRSSEEKFTPSPKELKSYLEDDDDDDLNIPDISSAINFSKFLNKSRAEQKEMMLGDDEPQSKPASSTIPNIPASQPKLEEKPVPIVEKRKSPTEHADEDFNNKYKNLLDDDDDDDFEIDDKFFANSKLLGGKKEPEISPVSAAVPTIPTKKEEAKEEVKKEVESEEEDDDDEEQSNPAVQEEESDSFVDDEEEVKYELPKRQSTADEAKITEPIAQRKDGFDSRAEDKQSKGYDNDYDEDYEDDVEEVIDEVQESFEEEEEDEIEQSRIETKPSILSKPSFDLEEKKDDSPKILPQRSRSREDDDDDDEPVFAASSQPKTFGSNSNNSNNLKVDAKVDNLPSIFGNKIPSSLAPLPDLKVPSRFGNNLKDLLTDDAKSFDSSSQGKLQSKKSEDSDKGPEFSEEELEEEEEFSQLDHDLSVNKSFESSRGPGGATGEESSFSQDIPQGKASNVQTKVVNSRYEETKETKETKEDTNSTSSMGNRANVSRLSQQSTIRSTRGWNDVDERRDNDFAMDEDEDDEETDQTELPYRGASFAPSIATIPGRGQRGGMQLQEADDVANLEFSSDQRHNADDSELHTSYRSNQEEDDDGHLQKNNEQKDDDGEIIIHHDEEEEFDDFEEEEEEEESTPAYQPRAAVKKEIEAPVKAFTTTNKIHEKKQQNEEDDEEEEEDEYNDDYGDDFENEEENLNNSRFSNKASNKGNPPATSNNNNNNNNTRKQEVEEDEEIEEIEEEIDEEDADKMSVGGQSESDDDDDGLGQRWAPKSKPGLTSSNSSLFRQQSGTLPTLNNNNNNKPANRGRYDFSKLNDDDDEDEDEDDNAYTFDLNRGSGSGSGRESKYQSKDEIQKRLKEIDQQVTSMEDEDEEGMLSNIKSTFGKNNTNNNNNNSRASSTASSLRKSSSDLRNLKDFDDRDEDSVASENLSVGDDDNSEEESFSVGH